MSQLRDRMLAKASEGFSEKMHEQSQPGNDMRDSFSGSGAGNGLYTGYRTQAYQPISGGLSASKNLRGSNTHSPANSESADKNLYEYTSQGFSGQFSAHSQARPEPPKSFAAFGQRSPSESRGTQPGTAFDMTQTAPSTGFYNLSSPGLPPSGSQAIKPSQPDYKLQTAPSLYTPGQPQISSGAGQTVQYSGVSWSGQNQSFASTSQSQYLSSPPGGLTNLYKAPVAPIDPKYVGELETSLGRLRMENSTLLATVEELGTKLTGQEAAYASLQKQLEAMHKDVAEAAQLKAAVRQLEFDLASKQTESKSLFEQNSTLRTQLFQTCYDKYAFEATQRDNLNLRDNQKHLSSVLENLKKQFEEFVATVGVSPADLKKKEEYCGDLEEKLGAFQQRLREKDQEIDRLKRENEDALAGAKNDLEREKQAWLKEKNEQMYRSTLQEDSTDLNIMKRRIDSLKKENELLKKQYQDLKSQFEAQAKGNGMYASGYFDPEKLGTRAGTLRKDAAQSKDLMMRDLEIKELKQEKNYLQKELSNAKESAEKLQKQLREHLSRPQAPPALAASAGDKQQIMNFYLEQISTLDQDNKLLREELAKAQTTLAIQSQQKQADREFDLGSDAELAAAHDKVRSLEEQVRRRDAEIADLKEKLAESKRCEQAYLSANNKLMDELHKAQEYMRALDSMNVSNITQSNLLLSSIPQTGPSTK